MLEQYINAIQTGDTRHLEKMLSKDISVMVDGGNISIVAERLTGVDDTIKLMTYVYREYQQNAEIKITTINHQPALLFYHNGIVTNCQVFATRAETGTITGIYSIVDPNKLKNLINN